MKKIYVLLTVVVLTVCMSACAKKAPKDIASEQLKKDVSVLETYDLDVKGTYDWITYYEGKETVHDLEKEFTGFATNIQIKEITDDKIKVNASISNKRFKLTQNQEITYHYSLSEDNVIVIDAAEIEKGDMSVEPVLKFDDKKFWKIKTLINVIPDKKEITGAREEELKMQDIVNVEFDPKLEKCKNSYYNTVNGDVSVFNQSGEYIFTTKDGKKYNGSMRVEYMPNYDELEDGDIDPYWSIYPFGAKERHIDVSELK